MWSITHTLQSLTIAAPDLAAQTGGPAANLPAGGWGLLLLLAAAGIAGLAVLLYHRLRQARAALAASDERLRLAMEASNDGIWDWNLVTGEMELTPRVYEMMGYRPYEFRANSDDWMGHLHPDDRAAAMNAIQEGLSSPGKAGLAEYRLRQKDGGYLWVLSRGKLVERTPDGEPMRIVGTLVDITGRKEARMALEESEARFRGLFDLGLVGVAIATPGRELLHVNDRLCEILGRTAEELKTVDWSTLTHPDDLAPELEHFEAMMEGRIDRYRMEKRFIRPEGTLIYIQLSASCHRDADGRVRECIAFVEDITERKEARAAIEASEERFRSFFELGTIGMAITSPDNTVQIINDRLCEITGYSHEEMASLTWADLTHPDDVAADLEQYQAVLDGKLDGYQIEKRIIRPGGAVAHVAVSVRAVRRPNGSVDQVIALVEDITERKEAQAALEERDRLFESLTAHVPGAIFQLQMWPDGAMAFQYVSEGARDIFEVEPEEVLGNTAIIFQRTHPDDLERVMASIMESYQNLSVWTLEFRVLTPTRGVRWMHGRSRPEAQPDGSVMWYGYINDITGRKAAEDEARQSEERAQRQRAALALLATSTAFAAGDLDLAKKELTEAAARTLDAERASLWQLSDDGRELVCFELFEAGKERHSEGTVLHSEDYLPYFEAIARDGRVLAHDAQTDPVTACFAQEYLKPNGITSMLDAGYHLEGRLGGVVCIEHTGEPRRWRSDEESFVTTLAALTAQMLANAERKRAEAALAARDATFAKLSENVPGFLFQYQMWPDGRAAFPFASEGMRTVYEVDPEDVREDASIVWEHRSYPDDLAPVQEAIVESMRLGTVWSQTFRVKLPTRGVRWMRGQARPESQPDGSTIWHGYISDITEQVEAFEERRQLEQQFERTQRLESLGVMAGGIAHDFNNILMAVMANAEVIQRELPADSNALRPLSEIQAAAERAAELCRQMLAYAGKSSMVSEQVHFGPMVRELAHLLRASIPKKVRLDIDETESAPAVEGDASQLSQVVMNLIINGAEAIKSHGTVTVRITETTLHEGESMRQGYDEVLPPGRYCLLEVIDDGCGMDTDTRPRIFEPFYTTKFTGRGLGLAAVLGIVRAHNGALAVKSKPGEGTQFRILFPASATHISNDKPATPAAEERAFQWDGGVLLVDDEAPLRIVGQRMLERMGCRVWTAEDGVEGLNQYDAHAGEIDLVILDLTMPRMDGHETLVELRKREPGLPIIIASGFTEEDLTARFQGQAVAGTLQKPFGYRKLEAAVRAFLARHERV